MQQWEKKIKKKYALKNRQETMERLKELLSEGYKYVVREPESEWLLCFSLEPKKYGDGEFWGYVNEKDTGAQMAKQIKNTDITEIKWTNKVATSIEAFLDDEIILTG